MASTLGDLVAPRTRMAVKDDERQVEFDASIDETHVGQNEITDYPIEEGANPSDHSRPRPRTLTAKAIISNTPATLISISLSPSEKRTRGKTAWEVLDGWRKDGTIVKVRTTFFRYGNMLIESISVPRRADNADGVEFDISFRQIFTVASRSKSAPVRSKKPKQKLGKKSTSKATNAQDEEVESFLFSVGAPR